MSHFWLFEGPLDDQKWDMGEAAPGLHGAAMAQKKPIAPSAYDTSRFFVCW